MAIRNAKFPSALSEPLTPPPLSHGEREKSLDPKSEIRNPKSAILMAVVLPNPKSEIRNPKFL